MGTHPQNKFCQTRGIYFIPKIIPLLILYVLKPEPRASRWHVSDRRPAGVGLPASISPPPGPKSLQSQPAGVSAMHPSGRTFLFSLQEAPCSRGLASWNENSRRMSHELGLVKGTCGPLGSSSPTAHVHRQQPRGCPVSSPDS